MGSRAQGGWCDGNEGLKEAYPYGLTARLEWPEYSDSFCFTDVHTTIRYIFRQALKIFAMTWKREWRLISSIVLYESVGLYTRKCILVSDKIVNMK